MSTVYYGLDDFISDMNNLIELGPTQESLFDQGSRYLKQLILNPNSIKDTFKLPYGKGPRPFHGSYLLHRGSNGLSIVSIVWGPGDHIDPHDHLTWGMIGVMENCLTETRFKRIDDQKRNGFATLEKTRADKTRPGEISLLVPVSDEIHQIDNETDRPTVEIHVYGKDLSKLNRHKFDLKTNVVTEFKSGKYDNELRNQ